MQCWVRLAHSSFLSSQPLLAPSPKIVESPSPDTFDLVLVGHCAEARLLARKHIARRVGMNMSMNSFRMSQRSACVMMVMTALRPGREFRKTVKY